MTSAWRGPAGWADRLIVWLCSLGCSEVFGRAHAEQGQAAGQHRPGGFGDGRPGAVGGRGFLVPGGERRGGVVEVEEGARDRFEVPGEPVGGAVAGCAREYGGVRVEQREQGGGRLGGVDVLTGPRDGGPEPVRAPQHGTGAGVRVPDPEEGVG